MQVSVIIPTYNHCDYVLQTLESVFAQSFSDYEVIVVNDGSPDNTSHVLAPLVQQGRIRYIEQTNAGQAAARNKGLAQATGEFIAFLDDDDLWPPDKLQWQVQALQNNPDLVFVSGIVQYINEKGEFEYKQKPPTKPVTFETLFKGNPFVSPGQILIRATALRASGGLNEDLWGTDDYDLWLRLAMRGKVAFMPQVGLHYRLHATNASKNTEKMYANTLSIIDTYLEQAPPAKRAALSRDFHRWLYISIGVNPINYLRVHKLKSFPSIFHYMPKFSYLAKHILRDRQLLRRVLRECTPHAAEPLLKFLEKKLKF